MEVNLVRRVAQVLGHVGSTSNDGCPGSRFWDLGEHERIRTADHSRQKPRSVGGSCPGQKETEPTRRAN
jgi:hypothetical protein